MALNLENQNLQNQNLPKAYCINLDTQKKNIENIYNDWSKYLNIERVSAELGGRIGCRLSHIKLFERLKELDDPYFIVMEDDVYPTKNFNENIWNNILEFITNNNTWDMITFDPLLHFDCKSIENFSDMFFKIDKFRSAGMIIYNGNFFKKNFNNIKKINTSLDVTMTHNKNFIKLTYKKLLVRQYTNKGSLTSNSSSTTCYDNFWNKTENLLDQTSLK